MAILRRMSLRPQMLAALAMLALLSACARDREPHLRTMLDDWFHIGDTLHFTSHRRCTAAMFRLAIARPHDGFTVHDTPEEAVQALRDTGVSALRMERYAPHDLTDALLLSGDGFFGKQALHAGALAGPCLDGTPARTAFFAALTRPGATLAYEAENGGVMILDPVAMRLFYVAGDVW